VTTVQAAAAESYAPRKVLLANGTVARVRSSTPEDRDALLELHRNASDNSIYLRFFAVNRSASEAFVDRVCAPSPTSWSLVAEHGGRVVGIATAAVDAPGTAEVAMLVDERLHGQGIGTLLLEHLAQWSLARGVSTFSAEVLAANVPMLRVFHDAGFEFVQQRDHEVLSMTMDIRPSAASLAASGRRERAAERRSLAPLLEPAGVCVLGVSRRRGGIGREVLENILAGGYGGTAPGSTYRACDASPPSRRCRGTWTWRCSRCRSRSWRTRSGLSGRAAPGRASSSPPGWARPPRTGSGPSSDSRTSRATSACGSWDPTASGS
jgi:GNAT superfamily N-acetyltransferase